MYTNSAASSVNRGPCISRIIGLLSLHHTLRYLTLEFENSDLLLAFMGQTGLTQSLSDMRGIGRLRLWVPGTDEHKKKRLLQQAGLWETFVDMQNKAQRQPAPPPPPPRPAPKKPSESYSKALLVVERTEQRAMEMLASAKSHRTLLAEREAAKEELRQSRKTLKRTEKDHDDARVGVWSAQHRLNIKKKEAEAAAKSASKRIEEGETEEEEEEEEEEEGDCIVVASRIA